ncbi:hypothetical protein ACH5RR_023780 [Cinchona calisaya]|uniref:Homeobox domain-containing protein n=1 Tax=Cinchona calisaya TaxID=153742 RepID=A0ABD2ZCR1_9GENT
MGEKNDGLRLSLSLGCGDEEKQQKQKNMNSQSPSQPLPLSLMRTSFPFMQQQNIQQQIQHKSSFLADVFPSSSERNAGEPRLFLRGIDVNQPATVIDCDEEVMVSSPISTVSSGSGKRSEREENEADRGSSSLEDDGGEAVRKKLRLSKEQAAVLEETFKEHNTLNPKQKLALAKQLNLRPRQVEVWFQNRRARTKLKQTEVDCEYLKRCCENLTEENRRLQKEVNELRALKLSPQFYMNMNPPTTLTMCPQCERVAVSSSSSSSAAASTSIAATSSGITHQQNTLTASNQRSMPLNPWTAIFRNQSLDVHQPRS